MKNQDYTDLFKTALEGEGKLLKGFSSFHKYSFGNQMLAMWQMKGRGIDISPINTFKGWQKLGRQVQRGQKAIALCMPVSFKKDKGTANEREAMAFVYKNNWFAMSQTEGEDVTFFNPNFDFDRALSELNIVREEFKLIDGNVQGYAKVGTERILAINPVAERPEGTLIHEIAHILLGHCTGDTEFVDSVTMENNLQEVEAEGVALCVSLALGIQGTEFSVGYIRNWWKGSEIPADSIKKIFRVTNEILKAGQEKPVTEEGKD